jgi:hypothetical protein
VRLPWLPNDGSLHAELPAGTPYGLIGTSSFYKRESFPGYANGNSYDGLDVFNTFENGQSPNWGTQGADAGRYTNDEIWAVRVVALEPHTHRSYGPNNGQQLTNHANERMRILGEIPLRKGNPDGTPVLDPEGNPDTSFLAKIPADTPFTFQTLDSRGLVLNMAQTWHQVRPGETRWNCGGCHAHSQQPLAFSATAASRAGYRIFDLSKVTPLLTRDAMGQPALNEVAAPRVDVEFLRDVRPILQRSCAPCHTGANPPGNLDLSSLAAVKGVPGDYYRLAADGEALFGHKPLTMPYGWRQTNASRYVRAFQSRRSLLTWKVFGVRLDGWTNADHPTESVPGDANTLPPGANVNDADIDFTGQVMPPPGTLPALTEDEKITIARWIDMGCPLDEGPYGWFLDDLKPTLTVSQPRAGENLAPVSAIVVGAADANSGIAAGSLSVKADFALAGRPAGSELADLAQSAGDGIWRIPITPAFGAGAAGTIRAEVRDVQGNVTRVAQRFTVR